MKDGMNEEGQKGGCTVTLECHLLACLRVPQPIQRVPAARRGLHCGVQLVAGLGPAALTDQRTPERRLRLHGTTFASETAHSCSAVAQTSQRPDDGHVRKQTKA